MSYMTEANAIAARLRGGAAPVAGRKGRGPSMAPSAISLAVLRFMREFFAENDQLPPLSHIARRFGWASIGTANWHVAALTRHGLVELNACGKLRFVRGQGGVQ